MSILNCFKAYDIRGRMPDELNEDIAWRVGRATAEFLKPKTMIVGGDIRQKPGSQKPKTENRKPKTEKLYLTLINV
ncbi:hypothetical protein [Endozoicomonas sp. YOMI1]|uniref:hypothetical protein n=1 Tax=Endozoicomonas sp. YOMI1 TaxID=2828739 RepID=UPI0027D2C225|nr:hypothetical protein [Endozoicomonas sp. YOMI1]